MFVVNVVTDSITRLTVETSFGLSLFLPVPFVLCSNYFTGLTSILLLKGARPFNPYKELAVFGMTFFLSIEQPCPTMITDFMIDIHSDINFFKKTFWILFL
jgi:hypothetical protein